MLRTSNPVLSKDTFTRVQMGEARGVMTVRGTMLKVLIMFLCLLVTASWTWGKMADPAMIATMSSWMIGSGILGFVLAMVIISKPTMAPVLAPLYALVEGVFIGAISAFFESRYPGLVYQAVGLTFAVMAAMLFCYTTRIVVLTEKLRSGITMMTMAIGLFYIVGMVMNLFGGQMPLIHSSGPMGILFSLFVVGLAAFNLLLDFDFIEKGSDYGAPKYMEWYGAFGLIVTLVWLYLEILRLLAKLRDRR